MEKREERLSLLLFACVLCWLYIISIQQALVGASKDKLLACRSRSRASSPFLRPLSLHTAGCCSCIVSHRIYPNFGHVCCRALLVRSITVQGFLPGMGHFSNRFLAIFWSPNLYGYYQQNTWFSLRASSILATPPRLVFIFVSSITAQLLFTFHHVFSSVAAVVLLKKIRAGATYIISFCFTARLEAFKTHSLWSTEVYQRSANLQRSSPTATYSFGWLLNK